MRALATGLPRARCCERRADTRLARRPCRLRCSVASRPEETEEEETELQEDEEYDDEDYSDEVEEEHEEDLEGEVPGSPWATPQQPEEVFELEAQYGIPGTVSFYEGVPGLLKVKMASNAGRRERQRET
jgi:hypothetical protein